MKSWYLSPAERQALEAQLRHTHEAKLFRRLLAVLEVARGRSVRSVARELRVERRSVYYWLDLYERERTGDALKHQPGQGRPPDWSEEMAAWVEAVMDEPPLHFGYGANYWTVPLLEAFLAGLFPEPSLSGSTVRRGLKALGYVWKRFRYELLPDPQAAKKKRKLLRQIRALPLRTVLLAEDETDLLLFPALRAGWARHGEPPMVPISGSNARRTVFGTLHLRTGHWLALEQTRKRAEEFLQYLEFLREHYRKDPMALLLDENSIHCAEESQSLAEDLEIQLLWLPLRSPNLNPVDRLWGHGKRAVGANRQQSTIEEQTDLFMAYYQDLSPTERLCKAGMLSPKYWLYQV